MKRITNDDTFLVGQFPTPLGIYGIRITAEGKVYPIAEIEEVEGNRTVKSYRKWIDNIPLTDGCIWITGDHNYTEDVIGAALSEMSAENVPIEFDAVEPFDNVYQKFLEYIIPVDKDDHDIFIVTSKDLEDVIDALKPGDYVFIVISEKRDFKQFYPGEKYTSHDWFTGGVTTYKCTSRSEHTATFAVVTSEVDGIHELDPVTYDIESDEDAEYVVVGTYKGYKNCLRAA